MATNLGEVFYKLTLSKDEFDKSLGSSEKRLEAFDKKIETIGKNLSVGLTAPIIAAGAASLNFAKDAETAGKKFEGTFAGAVDKARDAVLDLNKAYGLSITDGTSLLASTASIVKGFGATSDQALELSKRVQELAAALAASNGVPVAEVSRKITSALLGETEGLKSLGIAINDSTIQADLLAKGQNKLVGSAATLAKANSVLSLAYKQSGDDITGFQSNLTSLSFQSDKTAGELKDLAVTMGTILIPVAKEVVGWVSGVVKAFDSLGPSTKTTIVALAAIAAGIGPVILGVKGLATALTFLAANPVIAAITALGLLTAATVTFVAASQDAEAARKKLWAYDPSKSIEDNKKQLEEITKATNEYFKTRNQQGKDTAPWIIADQKAQAAAVLVTKYRTELAEAENKVKKETVVVTNDMLAAEKKAAEEAAKKLAIEKKYTDAREQSKAVIESTLTEQQKLQKDIDKLQAVSWAANSQAEKDRLAAIEILKAKQKELNDQAIADTKAKLQAEAQAAKEAYKERFGKIDDLLAKQKEANATELQALQEKQAEIQAIDALDEEEKTKKAKALKQLAEDIKNAEIQAAKEAYKERFGKIDDLLVKQEEANTTEVEKLRQKQAEIQAIETLDTEEKRKKAEVLKQLAEDIKQAEIKAAKESTLEKIDQFQYIANLALALAKSIVQIMDNLASEEKTRIDDELYYKNQAIDAEIKSIEEAGAAKGELTEAEKKQIKDLQNAKIKATYEAEYEKYRIEFDAFQRKKVLSYAEIAIQTSIAIARAYAELGPVLGSAAMYALLTLGAAQIAAVATQPDPKPPKPPVYLAKGGVVSATPGGVSAVIGEGGNDELVAPLTDRTFSKLGSAIVDSMTGGTSGNTTSGGLMKLTIVLEGLGQVALDLTQDAMNSGLIRVPARIITKG